MSNQVSFYKRLILKLENVFRFELNFRTITNDTIRKITPIVQRQIKCS